MGSIRIEREHHVKTNFGAAMIFGTQPGARAEGVKPGDRVAAIWTDGGYYLATVTALVAGKFAVLYDDGDKGLVGGADLIPVPAAADFQVGDRVLACWKNARMFTGVITARSAFTYTVAWDDGDAPLDVARGRLVGAP